MGESKCVPLLGGFCFKDYDCIINNSSCIDNKCQCQKNLMAFNENECTECKFILHSEKEFLLKKMDATSSVFYGFDEDDSDNGNSCAYFDGRPCDPKAENPCCDPVQKCTIAVKNDRWSYQCKQKASLGQNCTSDFDCEKDLYAECSNADVCVCNENYVMKNKSRCEQLLGGQCYHDESCNIDNSACIENKCQCNPSFRNPDKYKCLPSGCIMTQILGQRQLRTKLGNQCKTDSDCGEVRHTKCSDNHECVCAENQIMVNKATCLPLLDGFCTNDSPCFVKNSVCINNECQCQDGYVPLSHNQCTAHCHPHLSFPCCESNNKCTKIFEWSVKRHISVCLKPVLLGDSCQTDLDCLTVKNSWCNQNKKCECVNNSVQHNPSTCSSLIGGHCLTDDDCLILNTVCTDYLCTCKPSFVYRPQDQCIPNISLGSSCEHNDDCDDPGHSECSEDKICVCKPRRFIKHNTCQPRLATHGTFCQSDDDCALIKYMKCSENNKCVCHDKTILINNTTCAPILGAPLRKSCVDTLDCDDIWHMKCSENKTCICKANHIEVNQALCKPLLGAICHSNECGVNNSVCVDYECQCKPSFRRDISHSTCSANYKCVCQENHVAIINNATCEPLLGGLCETDEVCRTEHSVCINNRCQCTNRKLDSPCKRSLDCTGVDFTECNINNNRCQCIENFVKINNSTCSPVIKGFCSNHEDCNVVNSICDNNYCQCKPKFFQKNSTHCVEIYNTPIKILKNNFLINFKTCNVNFAILRESCKTDNDCSDILHAKCSLDKKCICRDNNVVTNEAICSPLLGEFCWRNELCAVDNAV
ncbi:Protein of unknown function, partial [Cotesia congregata]